MPAEEAYLDRSLLIGSLSNYDEDRNDNFKKQ